MPAALPDEHLVAHVRAGDADAVELLFARHHEGLLTFCRHLLGGRDAAEDAVRTSFAQALTVVRRHDRPVNIKVQLFSIAYRRCAVALDDHPRGPVAKLDVAGLDPEVARDDELRVLLASVGRLPLDQRAVLVLSEIGTHARDELAAVVGCPGDKVGALLAQARLGLVDVEDSEDWTCTQVRGLLAAADGGDLRRATLRRHVVECAPCGTVRDALAHQRRCLGLVLPVMPAAGLRAS